MSLSRSMCCTFAVFVVRTSSVPSVINPSQADETLDIPGSSFVMVFTESAGASEHNGFERLSPVSPYLMERTAFKRPFNFPDSLRLTIPPMGPSLQPPINSLPIQMAGTDVRPINSASSARIAFPSMSVSSSTTVYLAPISSKTPLALMQKGQLCNGKCRMTRRREGE
jgi:hypothetical protein